MGYSLTLPLSSQQSPRIKFQKLRQAGQSLLIQKEIVVLVDKMIFFNKELHETPENSDKWDSIKSEIEKTDKKIDQEVYKLYDLTADEIKIIEDNITTRHYKPLLEETIRLTLKLLRRRNRLLSNLR